MAMLSGVRGICSTLVEFLGSMSNAKPEGAGDEL